VAVLSNVDSEISADYSTWVDVYSPYIREGRKLNLGKAFQVYNAEIATDRTVSSWACIGLDIKDSYASQVRW
jgi:hypothetical protein